MRATLGTPSRRVAGRILLGHRTFFNAIVNLQLKFSNLGFLHSHKGSVTAVKFVDDHTIVSAGRDGVVRVSALTSKLRGKVSHASPLYIPKLG